MPKVEELIGVYHADGGLRGEARYVIGKFLGTAHCALCDITHSPVRRKPEWDAMVQRLGLPFTLLHRNDMPEDVAAVVQHSGTPVVLARYGRSGLRVVLAGRQLEGVDGSVTAFEAALRAALATDA